MTDDFYTRFRDRFTFAPDDPEPVAAPEPPRPLAPPEPREPEPPPPDLFTAAAKRPPEPVADLDTSGPEPAVTRRRVALRERRPGDLGADTMAARFAAYDAAHPEAWAAIVRFADEALDAGARRFGMRAILERVRWERLVKPDAAETYMVNNNYAGFYARKLAALGPRYADALELREGRHVGG